MSVPERVTYRVQFGEVEHEGDLDDVFDLIHQVKDARVVNHWADFEVESVVVAISVPWPMTREMLLERLDALGRVY